MSEIQWYPGHMTKALRLIKEHLALVDVLIELLDARIPYSSKNPDILAVAAQKRRVAVLNKADLADEGATAAWMRHYEGLGYAVLAADSSRGKGLEQVAALARSLIKDKIERQKARGRLVVPVRAMIVGIPNVGKSTMINRYAKRGAARVADRPGVTKGKQWIKIKADFELLDTPGILWPKFDDRSIGQNLAITGAINDNLLDMQDLAHNLISRENTWAGLRTRYKIDFDSEAPPHEILAKIARSRALKAKDGADDLHRCAIMLLDEFREGKIGRITLELPKPVKTG